MRTIEVELPSGHKVKLREPRIATEEAVAASYTEKQLTNGQARRFARDLFAAAIVEFDSKPVDADFNPRKAIAAFADWNVLEAAYNSLLDLETIMATILEVKVKLAAKCPAVDVKLSDGRVVTLAPLTIDQVEDLEVKGRYSASQWFQALHDRAAAAIVRLNGEAVIPGVFNARVEIPLSRDWAILKALAGEMNNTEVDLQDFFPTIPA